VSHIATSESLVPITLAELLLLRRLIVPWSGGWKTSGCWLLLLRWPDHPSACLLLKSPALIVGNNPEPLGLSGGCCHWCLSLLLCPVSYNTILLGDGQCDGTSQVIRPTYSCPCLTGIRHPVNVPKSLDKFGIFPYLSRNVSPVLQTLQNIGDKEMRKRLHNLHLFKK
jgi:hypothetical protein